MSSPPVILSGLGDVAASYDALVCDVWGVVHDGARAKAAACEALKTFRGRRGPVFLITNAPRLVRDVKLQFDRLRVPADCYDAIITSGEAARAELARRAAMRDVAIYHLGPERDRGVFEGLGVSSVPAEKAELVLCTGLFDDDIETPDDYRAQFAKFRARNLPMLCANPDLVVQRGGRLVFCAGALAKLYAELGGEVRYFGKPHRAIYDEVRKTVGRAFRPLAIGDGIETDLKGANAAGIDALFIADGIHGEEIEPFSGEHLAALFERRGASAGFAMRTLVW